MEGSGLFSKLGSLFMDGMQMRREQGMNPVQAMVSRQQYEGMKASAGQEFSKMASVANRPFLGLGISKDNQGSRGMSAYNQFVAAHIKTVPGANQREKMANVAKLWKEHKAKGAVKGGSAAVHDSTTAPAEGAGFKPRRVRKPTAEKHEKIMAPAVVARDDPPAMTGGARRKRVHGAGISLTAANEIPPQVMRGAGAYDALHALTGGCASCDEAQLHGEGFNPARLAIGALSTIMPGIGLLSAIT